MAIAELRVLGLYGTRPGSNWIAMDEREFEIAVGEAAQDAVWKTQHPLTHRLAEDDPRREQYLREYQSSIGRQVLAAIARLRAGSSSSSR